MATLAEELANVQAAIVKAEAAQAITAEDGRSVIRGQLKVLYDERRKLRHAIAAEAVREKHGKTIYET